MCYDVTMTMEQRMSSDTPEERARQVLVAMLDAGEAPTARAVRQRSGVAMQVAADVVAAWRRERDAETKAPPVPPDVQTRLVAVWAQAYAAAEAIHRPARDAADQLVAQLAEERDGLLSDVAELETRVEQRDRSIAQVRGQLEDARAENGVVQARLEEVRARATALEARASEQDQTIGQLRAELEDLRRAATTDDTEKAEKAEKQPGPKRPRSREQGQD